MSTPEQDAEGLRGTELADGAEPLTGSAPQQELGEDGLRGDGLADGADSAYARPHGADAQRGLRGEDLATDA